MSSYTYNVLLVFVKNVVCLTSTGDKHWCQGQHVVQNTPEFSHCMQIHPQFKGTVRIDLFTFSKIFN